MATPLQGRGLGAPEAVWFDYQREGSAVGMECAICGKKPVVGNQITRRGKAKYLGGVGRKVTGISKRKFKPNLQRVLTEREGVVRRIRVCTQCIRSGRVQRPVKTSPFQMAT